MISMPGIANRQKGPISKDARTHRDSLQPYPVLDVWMNPVTRGLARRFMKQETSKARSKIDFEYRLTKCAKGDVECFEYETGTVAQKGLKVLYVHAGILGNGSPEDNASVALPICHKTGAQTIAIDYSPVPEARFPKQLDELTTVYDTMLAEDPNCRVFIIAVGMAAGMSLSAVMRWRDEGKKLPSGLVFLSGMFDGLGASDTLRTLDGTDPLIRSQGGKHCRKLFRYYAPDHKLDHADISPVYGNFAGLPPILAHVGSREVMLGDTARIAEAARLAGVPITLRVFDGMFHQFHLHWNLSETRAAQQDIADFIEGLRWF